MKRKTKEALADAGLFALFTVTLPITVVVGAGAGATLTLMKLLEAALPEKDKSTTIEVSEIGESHSNKLIRWAEKYIDYNELEALEAIAKCKDEDEREFLVHKVRKLQLDK